MQVVFKFTNDDGAEILDFRQMDVIPGIGDIIWFSKASEGLVVTKRGFEMQEGFVIIQLETRKNNWL